MSRPATLKKDKGLSSRQKMFVDAYLKEPNATKAAIIAGYAEKSAGSMGCQLLDETRYPLVVAEIRKKKEVVEKKTIYQADDVLRYIHTAMSYCPLEFFIPGENGGWLCRPEDWPKIPKGIGCLIEEVKRVKIDREDAEGNKTVEEYFQLKMVSKTAAMALAAKHQLDTRLSVQMTTINWDELYQKSRQVTGAIEDKIQEAEFKVVDDEIEDKIKREGV